MEYIQECKLAILFSPEPIKNEQKEFQVYTLFELADTTIRSDMDQAPIYFPADEKLPIDFRPYVNNPLIPSEIAIKLRDYYLLDVQHQGSYDAVVMSNVIITRFEQPESMRMNNLDFQRIFEREYGLDNIQPGFDDRFVTYRHVPALQSFGKLKSNNKNLYNLIVKWLTTLSMMLITQCVSFISYT